jgi:aspartate aminotransferase-like enzyme
LLATYAAKHGYSLRQATQRVVAIGLKAEWEREKELAREKKEEAAAARFDRK